MDITKHTTLSSSEFGSELKAWVATRQEQWNKLTQLALAAFAHYFQHSNDSSQVQHLYEALEQAKAGSEVAALAFVVNNATGIKLKDFKTDKSKLQGTAERREEIFNQIEAEGLRSMVPSKAKVESTKDENEEKDIRLKIPAAHSKQQWATDLVSMFNRAMVCADAGDLEGAMQAIETNPFDSIVDVRFRRHLEQELDKIHEVEQAGLPKEKLNDVLSTLGKNNSMLDNKVTQILEALTSSETKAA